MDVPLLDLGRQWLRIKPEVMTEVEKVMDSTRFILGDYVKQLELDIARRSQAREGIGVANGSDALHLALRACGVGVGDEVITTAFTFFATAGAIARGGAIPVFVDIDEKTYNIDPSQIEEKITSKTKAIIPVHLYGQMADMETISKIAARHNLHIVEDAAQAIGASNSGKQVGELSRAATFSFFPTKNLGGYGDGGMVITSDVDIAEKLRIMRVHGSKPKYYHHTLGYNSRLDELQAAILNVKIKYLDEWEERRQEIAKRYNEGLSKVSDLTTPFVALGNEHVYHQYTIRLKERDRVSDFLQKQGVRTQVYYPVPLHLQPVFQSLGYREGDLPVTEKACKEVLSLPIYPELESNEQDYVIDQLQSYLKK